jgi:hypothetical protein
MPGIASGAEMRPGARSIRQAPSSRQEAPLQQNSMIAGAAISAFDQPLRRLMVRLHSTPFIK